MPKKKKKRVNPFKKTMPKSQSIQKKRALSASGRKASTPKRVKRPGSSTAKRKGGKR